MFDGNLDLLCLAQIKAMVNNNAGFYKNSISSLVQSII
jgi:hypothetical protein